MWLIDGNKLKEKAVPLLFPTEMEPCGHLSEPVQAVAVSEIEDMMCRESVEVVRCGNCSHRPKDAEYGMCRVLWRITHKNDFCSYGERKG